MTRDDVIRMAREAGGKFHGPHIEYLSISESNFIDRLVPAILAYEREGRCKNCGDKLDDTRPYCDEPCRDDHWERIKSESRNGKYRGG